MKKTLLSAVMIASFGVAAFAPQTVHAAVDGTITISGQVVAQTCTVDAKASGSNLDSKTVQLPLVLAPALATVGAVAGLTTFSIVVAKCDSSLSTVSTLFSGGNIVADGNLANPAGGATGVEVQLLDNNTGTPAVMSLNAATPAGQGSNPVTLATSGTSKGATLNYSAQYIAKAAITAGTVNPTVQFTMIYQ